MLTIKIIVDVFQYINSTIFKFPFNDFKDYTKSITFSEITHSNDNSLETFTCMFFLFTLKYKFEYTITAT